jgi:NTE family protein
MNNIIKIVDINTLVISGGVMKGLLYIGTLKLLSELNILNKIKFYYGTSIGGILLTCLNLGWDINDILKFSIKFPLDCLIDYNIDNLGEIYGLVLNENYETLFKKVITYKGHSENITFQELYKLTNKELNLITYSIKNNKCIVLNYETEPNLEVWKGLYATSSLPILVPPLEINDDIYIDGGITENFPINRVKLENKDKMIGICSTHYKTDWDSILKNINNKNIINYFEYSIEILKILYYNSENYSTELCFRLDNNSNANYNFGLDEITKINIIDTGYNQAKEQINIIIEKLYLLQLKEIKIKNKNNYSKYNEI